MFDVRCSHFSPALDSPRLTSGVNRRSPSAGVQEIRHAYRHEQDDIELTQLNDQNQAVFFAAFTGVGSAVVQVNLPEPACVSAIAIAAGAGTTFLCRRPRR